MVVHIVFLDYHLFVLESVHYFFTCSQIKNVIDNQYVTINN